MPSGTQPPPSGEVVAVLRVQMWSHWASVAIENEKLTALARIGILTATDDRQVDYAAELRGAIVAIAASSHCLDSFYGLHRMAVPAELRSAWRKKGTPRPRQILETLKLAFGISSQKWLDDFDWLFELRDAALHHDAAFHAPTAHPVGGHTAREYVDYSLESVSRGVALMLDVLDACAKGKGSTADQKSLRTEIAKLRLEREAGALAKVAGLATNIIPRLAP